MFIITALIRHKGANCLKLAEWAKANGVRHVELLEMFKGPYHDLERLAEEVARRYEDMEKYIYVAKAIRRYELDFWRAVASSI